MSTPPRPRFAAIIIGDEVLSAKVVDANTPLLIQRLAEHGITLESIHILPDHLPTLAAAIREASTRCDHVITSGGVGPTHDDVTMDAAAEAFSEPIAMHLELRERLQSHRPGRHEEALERISRVPESAQLLWGEGMFWPVIRVRNVSLLPGVPRLFARCLEVVLQEFQGVQHVCHKVDLTCSEADILPALDTVVAAHPQVSLGSYPRYDKTPWKVRVTLEAPSVADVDRATDHLIQLLDSASIHAIHRGSTLG